MKTSAALVVMMMTACVMAMACTGTPDAKDPTSAEFRAEAGRQLETAASLVDRYGKGDAHDKQLAGAMRIVAGWLSGGFSGTKAELEQAVTLVRSALAEARRQGHRLPPELVAALGLDVEAAQ